MLRQIFVNLPIREMERSRTFFTQLGLNFNPRFTNAQGACLEITDNIYAMLLVESFFQGFIQKPISDAHKATEVILALSVDSRAEVEEVMRKAVAAGATRIPATKDYGFMVQDGFADLDGHQWEVFWMDETAASGQM